MHQRDFGLNFWGFSGKLGSRRAADPAYSVNPDRIGIKTAWAWAAHGAPIGHDKPHSQAPEPRLEQLVGANGNSPRGYQGDSRVDPAVVFIVS